MTTCDPATRHECPEPHCRICWQAHVTNNGTCAPCLARVRNDLHEIGRLYAHLLDEAENRGINSEAANFYGPAADPEARGHLEASIAAGRIPPDYLDEYPGKSA